jgi:hypothetical protein
MPSFIDAALLEASDPTTSPERLRQLSNRKRRHERDRLRRAVAANPNADDDLLCGLASDYPREVVGNPRFQLLQLSGEAWWKDWGLRSLCSLTLAAGNDAPPYLQAAMKSRFEEIHDDYSEYVSIVRRETWCFARSVEILAGDGEGRAPFDIDFKVELEVMMEGRNDSACLEIEENAAGFSRDWVSSLLQSLKNEDIESLFEVFCPRNYELDIVVEDEVEDSVSISTANAKIDIKGYSVLLKATGQTLFDVHVFYRHDEEALPNFSDGELQVPVYELINGESKGLSRGSKDDLGVLEPLWGWEPVFLAPEIPKSSWEKWLSTWIKD